ncbi:MAG: hypothetical protein KDK36_08135 [Leptospiraceae bacterium]|nr:hypothetical protein [Leptospiraceae bacterium]
MKFLAILAIFSFGSLFAVPTTMKLEEKEYYRYIQTVRSKKFADREIDRLHYSIANTVGRIQEFVNQGSIADAARYNDHLPEEPVELFKKDKDGNIYFTMFLGQGLTYEDYPTYHLYNTRVYIYFSPEGESASTPPPSKEESSNPEDENKPESKPSNSSSKRLKYKLTNVIVQFNRVNTTGTVYVKEMRRMINDTPNNPGPPKVEGEKDGDIPKFQEENITDPSIEADTNEDIKIEYYTSNDLYLDDNGKEIPLEQRLADGKTERQKKRYINWVDEEPKVDTVPGLERKLEGQEGDPLPFPVQKKIYLTYRNILRELNSKIKLKLHQIELNHRRTIHKIMEFN